MFLEAKTCVSQTSSMVCDSQKAAVALLKFIVDDGPCQRKEEQGHNFEGHDAHITLVHCTPQKV